MLKRLYNIVEKEQNISAKFYAKVEESDMPKATKQKVKNYFKKKVGSREKLLTVLKKQVCKQKGGNNNDGILGQGGFATVYREGDSKVYKQFHENLKPQVLRNIYQNLVELNQRLKEQQDAADLFTYDLAFLEPPKNNSSKTKTLFRVYSKLCDGDLVELSNKDGKAFIKAINVAFNKLIDINFTKHLNIVQGDVKLENILYKNENVYFHDVDGVFVFDTGRGELPLHVSQQDDGSGSFAAYSREISITPEYMHPFYNIYTFFLQDDEPYTADTLKETIKIHFDKYWNSKLPDLKTRETTKKLFNRVIDQAVQKSFVDFAQGSMNKTQNVREWVTLNLYLCDVYSFYASLTAWITRKHQEIEGFEREFEQKPLDIQQMLSHITQQMSDIKKGLKNLLNFADKVQQFIVNAYKQIDNNQYNMFEFEKYLQGGDVSVNIPGVHFPNTKSSHKNTAAISSVLHAKTASIVQTSHATWDFNIDALKQKVNDIYKQSSTQNLNVSNKSSAPNKNIMLSKLLTITKPDEVTDMMWYKFPGNKIYIDKQVTPSGITYKIVNNSTKLGDNELTSIKSYIKSIESEKEVKIKLVQNPIE